MIRCESTPFFKKDIHIQSTMLFYKLLYAREKKNEHGESEMKQYIMVSVEVAVFAAVC